jgi:hypothetical protein
VVDAEPMTHMAHQDNPAGTVETAIVHPHVPEADIEIVTPTARQHRLADTVETVMTRTSRVADTAETVIAQTSRVVDTAETAMTRTSRVAVAEEG